MLSRQNTPNQNIQRIYNFVFDPETLHPAMGASAACDEADGTAFSES